jgi:OOP family OmpA-OmpF porin
MIVRHPAPSTAASSIRVALPALAIVALGGCGSVPTPALDDARINVESAQNDPQVVQYAPNKLDEAVAALNRADAALAEGEGNDEVEHLAYLTDQRVEIARARVEERLAQEQIQQAGSQRTGIELEAERARAAELERQLAELQAEETERGYVMTLGDILFDVDRAELKPGGMREVQRLAEFMREFPNRSVVVEGHTDSTGDESYNLQLSERRAQSVQDALIGNGIEPFRIAAGGYGERYPVASNDSSAGRQQNRRVEVVILDEGEAPVPRN